MGLISRGRGRGRGNGVNFQNNGGQGFVGGNQNPVFHPGYPGMTCSPVGFHSGTQYYGTPYYGGSNFKVQNSKPTFYKRPQRNFRGKGKYQHAIFTDETSTDNTHYCETCDKSFKTEECLSLHKSEHETCNREGCNFTAHPKIIAKHIKMQHDSGLYERIGKLYTEEDIAKWIEERKKRYPTRKIVEQKKVLEQEKLNRGERIKEDKSKFNKSLNSRNKRNTDKKNFDRKGRKTRKNRRTKKKENTDVVWKHVEEIQTERKGVPAFSGIKKLNGEPEEEVIEKSDLRISDDEWEAPHEQPNATQPFLSSALGFLAAQYDSDEETEELPTETKPENIPSDDGSGPDEVKTVTKKNPVVEEKEKNVSFKKKKFESNRKNSSNDSSLESRSVTLLEKLLKNEIRHERNVILQCVHYVVKNNFFKT